MKRIDSLTLDLPADASYIPVATFAARHCAQRIGFSDEDVERICLAMEEACVHAFEFGYGGDRETLKITISRTSLGIRLATTFHGLPLNVELLPKYDPARALEYGDVTGISLLLIERMLDSASFSSGPDGLRTVSMDKHLPAHIAADTAQAARPLEPDDSADPILRQALPEDAEAISRLAFQSHGNVLFTENIYYPDRVREMIRSEEMTSVVLETASRREIVGHGALVKSAPEAHVEEMTFGIMNPGFRSRGGATAMANFLERNAVERGVYAIEVFAVTSHVHSQRSVLSNGFLESGLLLDTSSASRSWVDSEAGRPRIGNVIYIKYLKGIAAKVLHVPDRHRQIVERIYAQHGFVVNMEDSLPNDFAPGGETTLWSTLDIVEGWAMIGIDGYGRDVLAQVSERVRHACAQGITAIQMALPLEDPATRTMTSAFEDMGFFFAGACPVYDRKEYLILQFINSPQTEYETINVQSDFAHEIKQYVMSCDPRAKPQIRNQVS
ncbi:hypothetical protein H4684_002934 [Desulfomicrobium macestii]|uniref:N-acetyltransferase domain-containing protein n=1 Tax=Desulfomicrobium macestii TaxID=90731 RepID=A0ABR9H6D5_9BACT|nr:ATP-binding protein [Desulfomicrobium macestii]MBE1426269.1 hypothetical protein [Desulfomicrobium macestii]